MISVKGAVRTQMDSPMDHEARLKPIKGFLDDQGRVKAWPAKQAKKLLVLAYMADRFEPGRIYQEKEVNATIEAWHTFGDYFMLRRGMVDAGLMLREADGSRYWRAQAKQP